MGEDLEEDFQDQDQRSSKSQYTGKENTEESNLSNSEEDDDGYWILNWIDLLGLEDWPEHLQNEAK